MTPEAVLIELLARLGARKGGAVFVSAEEVRQWPPVAVAAMKSQKLLMNARPVSSLVCPGCERECVMPVHTLPAGRRSPASFIVCDKRDDINRVPVSTEQLTQWRCDAGAVCKFIAKDLGIRRSDRQASNAGLWEIDMARGDKRSQMLCLQVDGGLALATGTSTVPLAELVRFHDGEYSVDSAMIRQLVDSATTADPRYTPSNARREAGKLDTQAKYEGWRKEYRDLKRKRPNKSDVWYSLQIAKLPIANGRNPETIRKRMKK